jgi:hypothetical protein
MELNEPTQLQLGEAVGLEDYGDGEALEAESIISSSGLLFNINHKLLKNYLMVPFSPVVSLFAIMFSFFSVFSSSFRVAKLSIIVGQLPYKK